MKRSLQLFAICTVVMFGGLFIGSPLASANIPASENPNTARNNSSNSSGQVKDPALSGQADCDKNSCDLVAKYVNPFISLLTVLVGIAVVIGIIFGGIQVATSAGDPQQAANGKEHIRNALLAVVGYLLLYALLRFLLPGGFL